MKMLLPLALLLALTTCGRKDNLTLPPEPVAAGEQPKAERPLVTKPIGKSFILDALL